MLDSGADRDVISETVIEELNIATKEMEMRVITVDHCATNRRSLASWNLLTEVIMQMLTALSLENF